MDRETFLGHLNRGLAGIERWESGWQAFAPDETLHVDPVRIDEVLDRLAERLTDNFPYFHPRYAGQMLKPPHPVAMLAYTMTMRINPNNHALDGGAATSYMEREVVARLAAMFGFEEPNLGHLTASGTIANLEALWIARGIHPDKAIAFSDQAHYTHGRVCEMLRVKPVVLATDADGRIDLAGLEAALATGEIGTVVATLGTTGMGALDPLDDIVRLAHAAGARVHVDAAYGGFFALLATGDAPLVNADRFGAIASADSIVVDPHKHGLQPYGCGAVLFRDPAVGTFYQHDSPYTYFTSDELHLGEISFECSRAGASAAALWATLECLPLERDRGFGPVLSRTRQAALAWADLIRASNRLRLVTEPELDIMTFFALPSRTDAPRASEISSLTATLFDRTMNDPDDPLYLATFTVNQRQLETVYPEIIWDQSTVSVLRSVVMKPEQLSVISEIHGTILRHLEEYGG